MGRLKSIQRIAAFHSLVSSWHPPPLSPTHTSTLRLRGPKNAFRFPPLVDPCRLP
uniref:Uncharacterized protein n=1 Tax=Solanum lycopersicum TaxID=4081 RepID=A0A3Q7FHZ9_SOLLC